MTEAEPIEPLLAELEREEREPIAWNEADLELLADALVGALKKAADRA